MVRDLPMHRARRWVPPAPGMTPRLISGWPNLAVGEARMISVESASSQPPPSCDACSDDKSSTKGCWSRESATYCVAANCGNDGLADSRDPRPALDKLVLIYVRD